jgi:hypothetical protein
MIRTLGGNAKRVPILCGDILRFTVVVLVVCLAASTSAFEPARAKLPSDDSRDDWNAYAIGETQQLVVQLLHQQPFAPHRIETCSSSARSNRSGAIEGRPICEYSPSKSLDIPAKTASTTFLTPRSG